MHMNWRKSLLTSEHMLHARDMKIMLIEVSNTSLMSNKNHEEDKDVVDGLSNNSSRFPYKRISIVK